MSHSNQIKRNSNRGFTLVEVLVVAPIVILLIGAFISAIVSMTGAVIASRGSGMLSVNIQDALNHIDLDVKSSASYLATNSISPLTTPQGYNDDTTDFKNVTSDSSIGSMLILSSYSTSSNPLNSSQNIVYESSQPYACSSPLINTNPPVIYNIVYFVKNNNLWRRVILPSNYSSISCVAGVIGTPWQRPSCAPGRNDALCKSQDELLVAGVQPADFTINYYTSADSSNPLSDASNPIKTDLERLASLQTASSVKVSIRATATIAGRDVTQSGTIRSISRNTIYVPFSPTNPSVKSTGGAGTQLTLNWTAPNNNGGANITGYKIYRGSASGNETYFTTTGNVTTYQNNGLSLGVTYYYKILAVNYKGDGSFSGEINGKTEPGGTQTFNYSGSIVTFTVPASVYTMDITVKGAQGGSYEAGGAYGGLGASVTGTFAVTAGQVLSILVGQQPIHAWTPGGGGSYVALGATYSTATPLIVAGGGGGSHTSGNGQSGQITNITTTGDGGGPVPGTSGNGAASTSCGGGGGGFYTSGGNDNGGGTGMGGKGFRQGGAGGISASYGTGGFGGGSTAGYSGSCAMAAGSGGGYSGGSGQNSTTYINKGYGGGSFNSGTNQTNIAASQSGNGQVYISWGN